MTTTIIISISNYPTCKGAHVLDNLLGEHVGLGSRPDQHSWLHVLDNLGQVLHLDVFVGEHLLVPADPSRGSALDDQASRVAHEDLLLGLLQGHTLPLLHRHGEQASDSQVGLSSTLQR